MATQDPQSLARRLGRVGVWLGVLGWTPAAETHAAAADIDRLGYGALWFAEGPGGKEAFSHAGLLLAATSGLTVGTGIANIWARDAAATHAAATALGEAYPDRFVLGLGASHAPVVDARGHTYRKPLSVMRGYLDALDTASDQYGGPRPPQPVPRVLAALRDRMMSLAAQRAMGAHSYFVPPEHTAHAREVLGPDPLLVAEQAVVVDTDPTSARATAREHTRGYLALPNYANNLRALGYTEEDVADGGSDRLVDALVAWGDEDAIAARVRAQHDAGADHVAIQPLGQGVPVSALRRLAPVLLER